MNLNAGIMVLRNHITILCFIEWPLCKLAAFFCEFERHKCRFDWRQCKFECWENEIEWRIGCAWPKSSKLNDRKINLVDKIRKLTGKTYIIGFPAQFHLFATQIWIHATIDIGFSNFKSEQSNSFRDTRINLRESKLIYSHHHLNLKDSNSFYRHWDFNYNHSNKFFRFRFHLRAIRFVNVHGISNFVHSI